MSENLEMGIPLFALSQVVATPASLNAIAELGLSPLTLIHRHATGDWGDLGAEDQAANRQALKFGLRIFSSYRLNLTVSIWIITEENRSSTSILLPIDY